MLYLPRWATDCLKRRDPALTQSDRPLVLYEKLKGAMRLAAVDVAASRQGLSIGQALSDARAQIPGLEAREIDPAFIEATFADFADWHSYASPMVSVLTDAAPYGDLVLDITGVSHLFGGEQALLQRATGRLRSLGFTDDFNFIVLSLICMPVIVLASYGFHCLFERPFKIGRAHV